ncbi:hypothetical protein BDF14DRAFT_1807297 [Spinellus fusiger]|nr:hypothetical protein BDF14DRAFT_1807297 [Spinellus fusiger]
MEFLKSVSYDAKLMAATSTLSAIGALYLGTKIFGILKMLLELHVLSGIPLTKFGAGNGAWAVITGASDGIGKEFAEQLAKKKFNIVLISRTASKLEAIAEELSQHYGIKTKTYAMDFAKSDPKDFSNLEELLSDLRIGVLVNNVGTNHDIPTSFSEEDSEVINSIVEVNIKGAMRMSKIVLPQMRRERKGLILNLGSFAGLVATPYLSVYSAGKAFLCTWSQALGAEVAPEGIVVQNINTYFVVSSMSKIRRPTFFIPMPKPYVATVLSKIGLACGASTPYTSTPYPSHGLMNWVIENVFDASFWLKQNNNIQKDIRKRALRKREREANAKTN